MQTHHNTYDLPKYMYTELFMCKFEMVHTCPKCTCNMHCVYKNANQLNLEQ